MNHRIHIFASAALVMGSLMASTTGCELIASVDRTKIDGGAGGNSTTSTTGGGGATCTGQTCTALTDCPDTGNECVLRTCNGGCCGTEDAAPGTACTTGVCDPSAACVECYENANCTGTNKVCDTANSKCVGCLADADCTVAPNTHCDMSANQCVPELCANGAKDTGETDIDCGGSSCAACADGKTCLVVGDCANKYCKDTGSGLVCSAPACDDTVQNGNETDVDCGGKALTGFPQCGKCDDGLTCVAADDCASGVCTGDVCQVPACDDTVKNGDETDVDCGGSCVVACDDGLVCGVDADCKSGFCDTNNTCAPAPIGNPCTSGSQCASTFCADGVCCDTACGGLCQACSAAKTGGADGACAPVTAASDPDNECTDETAASCGNNGFCDGAGACADYPAGTECLAPACSNGQLTQPSTCDATGACVAGTTAACPGGQTCLDTTTCKSPCTTDTDCLTTQYCSSANCMAKKAAGNACAAANECTTGFCADSVCCDTTCLGTCRACVQVKTGVANGTCSNVSLGTDPDSECTDDGAASCDNNGLCGAGACANYANGTQCVAPSCTSGVQTAAATCNGSGTCATPVTASCSPYVCGATACLTSCTADANCVTGHYCDATNHCVAKKTAGTACGANNQCTTGICDVDGTGNCCTAACTTGGTCGATACDATGACTYPGTSTQCSAPSCTAGVETQAAVCNGAGTCPTPTTAPCTPFVCGTNACLTTCATTVDCATGNICDTGSHNCLGSGLANGANCTIDAQCTSGHCYVTGGGSGQATCHADLCSDGLMNGGESDVDCGGLCTACAYGELCVDDVDCASQWCNTNLTCGCGDDVDCPTATPSCNVSGSDATCTKVANGGNCTTDVQCTSGHCYVTGGGAGQATCHADLCFNGIQDVVALLESDIDCGGLCTGCVYGKVCVDGLDCASGVCNTDLTCGCDVASDCPTAGDTCDTNGTCVAGPTPYRHTILINGTNDFDAAKEKFTTTSPGYNVYITWDATNLYIGYEGADIGAGANSQKSVQVYIDTVAGGATAGMTYNTQKPDFSLGAFQPEYLVSVLSDGSFAFLAPYNGTTFVPDLATTINVQRNATNGFMEFAIPWAKLGSPAHAMIESFMMNSTNGAEWTYAGLYNGSFMDGYFATFTPAHALDMTMAGTVQPNDISLIY